MLKAMSDKAKKAFPAEIARTALEKLSAAYESKSIDAFAPLAQQDTTALMQNVSDIKEGNMAMTYGEVLPHSVFHMLALAAEKNPNLRDEQGHLKPGHFYDLGSGFGKTVILASLLGFEGDGIELRGPRFNVACKSLGRLGAMATNTP